MNYCQPYIFFSAESDEVNLRENIQRDVELKDILETGGINYQPVVFVVEGNRASGVMVQYTPERQDIVKSLANDFGVRSFFTTTANGGATFYNADGTISANYDRYRISDTKPIDNYIELANNKFLHFD